MSKDAKKYKVTCKVDGPGADANVTGEQVQHVAESDHNGPGHEADDAKAAAAGDAKPVGATGAKPAKPAKSSAKPAAKATKGKGERWINIQTLLTNDGREDLGIRVIKIDDGEFVVKEINDERVGVWADIISNSGYKYTAARHGIKVGTKILEINGHVLDDSILAGENNKDILYQNNFLRTILDMAWAGAKKNETHTISLKVQNARPVDGNDRWKIIRYSLSQYADDIGFKLTGTSTTSEPIVSEVTPKSIASKKGLKAKGNKDSYPTKIKYMAFQPHRIMKGIHYGTTMDQREGERGGILVLTSDNTTPAKKGSERGVSVLLAAEGSKAFGSNIFKNFPDADNDEGNMQKDKYLRERKNKLQPVDNTSKKEMTENNKDIIAATRIQARRRGRIEREKLKNSTTEGGGGDSDSNDHDTAATPAAGGAADPDEDAWKNIHIEADPAQLPLDTRRNLTDDNDRWNHNTMLPIIRFNARWDDKVKHEAFPFGKMSEDFETVNKALQENAGKKSELFMQKAVTVNTAMDQMNKFIRACNDGLSDNANTKGGGVVTLVVTDSNLGPLNNTKNVQNAGMRKRRKRNIRSLVRKRATKRKGTRHKGTRHKRTRHKGTRHKGTRHKGTRNKKTRNKKTKRKGTRRN